MITIIIFVVIVIIIININYCYYYCIMVIIMIIYWYLLIFFHSTHGNICLVSLFCLFVCFFGKGTIKSRAKEVRECNQNVESTQSSSNSTDDRVSSRNSNGSEKHAGESSSVKVHSLAVTLLVEFLESLEKAMFNASDGCAVALPPPNKVSQDIDSGNFLLHCFSGMLLYILLWPKF